jgi:DNA-binding GntR family transcriptional regulator
MKSVDDELKSQTRTEWLASRIADAVLAGELAPGARLDELSLAARYGVSRTPVREALRQLTATGLIESKPRRGSTVAHVTSEQLDKLFVAMGEIEAACARLSAMSMTPLERRRLVDLHQEMAKFVEPNDETSFAEANVRLHTMIYNGTHNGIIAEIAFGLRRRLAPFRRAQFRTPGRLPHSHAEHDAVVNAIVRGDAAAAHAAMLHHVSLVDDAFEQLSSATPELVSKIEITE